MRLTLTALGVALSVVGAMVVGGCAGDATSDAGPRSPRLVEAAPMGDALHVSWVNEDASCDAIEIERKAMTGSGAGEFAVVYTVPGKIDNKHDGTANEDATYTYRLRCKRAALYSAYSNEVSANPKKI